LDRVLEKQSCVVQIVDHRVARFGLERFVADLRVLPFIWGSHEEGRRYDFIDLRRGERPLYFLGPMIRSFPFDSAVRSDPLYLRVDKFVKRYGVIEGDGVDLTGWRDDLLQRERSFKT